MILKFYNFLVDTNFAFILNFFISAGLGFCSFFLAFTIKKKEIVGPWFTSLRYILILLSTAALSNAYSLLLLGYKSVQPSELFLNVATFVLLVWAFAYYVKNVIGPGTSLTEEKVLKFIESEHKVSFDKNQTNYL